MKFLILVSSFLAVAVASWEPIHEKYHGPLHDPKIHKGVPVEPAAVQHAREAHLMALSQASIHGHGYSQDDHHEDGHKWNGPQHYPVIHKGVPVEPAEIQHARAAHLEALSHASHNNYQYEQAQDEDYHHVDNYNDGGFEYYGNHEENQKWNGPLHYPKINKGVPVEPVEVQHARAAHLQAFSGIRDHDGDYSYSNQYHETRNHYETPKIGHDGKPLDTLEVEAAKSKHFAAVHDALARNSHGSAHHYRKRRGAESYAHFSSIIDHVVPVYQHKDSHHETGDSDGYQYAYEQIHAPVYGHHEDEHDNSQEYSYELTHAPVDGHNSNSYEYHYEQIHAPVYGHHDAHHHHQIPVIGHDGIPVDTPEVQHAKAAHLAAHAAAKSKHY